MMMMRAAVGLWVLSAVICLGRGDHHGDHHSGHGHDKAVQDTAVDGSANSVSQVNEANQEFSFHLYRKLAAHADSQGQNVFFSPSSVSTALAMLSVGAQGETHRQLFSGLGFNSSLLTQTDVDHAFQTLLQGANNASQGDADEGTAVFVDNRFKPKPEFLQTLKQSYFTEGFNVDFTKTTESADTINKYVEGKTNGKIDKLVESLDPNTVMCLISYIYYKGKWATQFDPKLTEQDDFHVDENTKVQTAMMNMEERFHTYHDHELNTTVLQLPFNSSYSMLLMLPDVMATLENAICPNHVTKWLKAMTRPRRHNLYVPKFSIKTSYKLNDVLSEMGMTDMFGGSANLRGISEEGGLAVSKVLHKATLDVDETGAEAAAATAVLIGRTIEVPTKVSVLKFNRPFMVMITERNTEKILFMGKILNPTV
ncbi:alpha-1-antitrypsin-like protein CM55-ST isoform X1 [Etheostoma spectabile]|uniref:alpha-1-antitrypsin-like protein CM55-ST isoform X1 n=1 Tax=Etheostoma spectabile TaxID=54343 RepID=UPI0013AEB77D|nr:alpha-1-antitrypsin-like protein CM55-ST isoform X1 [Etheostoma spectabile]XP_032364765.1 alpha-1-antitrypsin-like protein CM55-ST isoform X1 [Etheostoma spectabile]XP_032364766.1 alpha-1-antitrypsin-like protein CM55-ST isoform X1 [Etheostoma spectabile]